MNKKIIELADKAGFLTENGKFYADSFDAIDDEIYAFAELIIKECAGICMIEYDTGLEPAPQAPQIARQIKQHFGVE